MRYSRTEREKNNLFFMTVFSNVNHGSKDAYLAKGTDKIRIKGCGNIFHCITVSVVNIPSSSKNFNIAYR